MGMVCVTGAETLRLPCTDITIAILSNYRARPLTYSAVNHAMKARTVYTLYDSESELNQEWDRITEAESQLMEGIDN